MPQKRFKIGDMVAEKSKPKEVGFITKIQKDLIYIQFIHGAYAGKIYSSHKHWVIHVDDIIHEEEE